MTEHHLSSADLLWLALVLMVALAIAFLLPVTPQDYWWYLRIGRDTLAAGAVPTVDELSFSQSGAPMVYHSWGAAVLFWLLYQLGGLPLTVLLRGLLVAAAYGLVWLTARRLGAGRIGAALTLLLAVLASSGNWSMRPQLFAYPLFALALFILYAWQNGGKNPTTKEHQGKQQSSAHPSRNFLSCVLKLFLPKQKAVYWLPLLSLLWVNLHGSFIMLILLAGAALVFGRGDRRSLALAFAGILLATLVNPRGLGAWIYVYDSLTIAANRFSAEWSPPVNSGWQMNLSFLWLLAFPLLAALSPRKLSRLEWTWFLGFGFLALWGERYVIWFIFILTVLTPLMLADWERKLIKDSPPPRAGTRLLPAVNSILVLLLVLLPFPLLPGLRDAWWPDSPPATENTPIAATEWLAAHPNLPGPLWSEIGLASYIEFALPSRPPWMDTRFELFTVEQWESYSAVTHARYDWQPRLDEIGVNLLMVSTQYQPDLLEALASAPTWCEIYRDEIAVIYERCGGGE